MTNTLLQQIQDHLEFLGYSIDPQEDESVPCFIARHDIRSNLVIKLFDEVIFITSLYTYDVEIDEQQAFKLINDINKLVVISRWSITFRDDKPDYVNVERTCFGYDKKLFGLLLERSEQEIRIHMPKFSAPTEAKE
ncbi:MAG: hypothetical protein ACOYUZ_02265 [Patescibacteria group bacterium]